MIGKDLLLSHLKAAMRSIVGLNTIDLVHPEDLHFIEDLAERRLKGQDVVNEYEVRCITRNGKTIGVQRRNTLIEYNVQQRGISALSLTPIIRQY